MTIQEKIREELKNAMKAKDVVRLNVLKGLISAFTNESVALGGTPQTPLTDEQALKVITRSSKQRKDSIEQFKNGGRPELAEAETAELKIIEEFLPQMMSEEEIRNIVLNKKEELKITEKSQFGQLMKAVIAEAKGSADGAVVKKIIDEILG